MLPAFVFTHLRLTYRLRESLPHPAVQGSLWRGALGYALKYSLCLYADPIEHPCPTCPFYQHCAYPPIWEPVVASEESASSSDDAARPFVLNPPLAADRPLPAGASLSIGLTLLGPTLRDIPTLIRAAALLGERGIGRNNVRASLSRVEAVGPTETVTLWPTPTSAVLPLFTPDDIQTLAVTLPPDVTLNFVTLTRLKRERQIVTTPDPETIIRSLLRRFISLAALYGEPWYPESHILIKEAQSLTSDKRTAWHTASHVSSRQQRRMTLDGFEGRMTLYDLSPELRALLLLGSYLHVGKQATCGHGWYLLETATHASPHLS